jgi:hypothetical protein
MEKKGRKRNIRKKIGRNILTKKGESIAPVK